MPDPRRSVAALPPRDRAALLLDLDGTLLDIAPRPEAVVVPPGLIGVLRRLRETQSDAVAVVTGRPVSQINALLEDAPFAVAGEHGTAFRYSPGASIEQADLPKPPPDWIAAAQDLARRQEGVLFEPKGHGFVLHYRLASERGPGLEEALLRLLDGSSRFVLMPARMAWEVKPRGADKGIAVAQLLRRAPFLGRLPVFIGDDVTDEDGIAAAQALGGAGLRVPEMFGDAAGVRDWLTRLAAAPGAWPTFPTGSFPRAI